MKKNLKQIREVQKTEYEELVHLYKENDKGRENTYEDHKYLNDLKFRIKSLELDLLEKKYANKYLYTDVEPFEVIEECTNNKYIIREMKCVEDPEGIRALKKSFEPGGFVGHFDNYVQKWIITSEPEGSIDVIRRHKDGYWYNVSGSKFVIAAKPRKFYDYNF